MSTQQPEALRLADECGTGYPLEEDAKKAAAELRRLHAELESIKQAIKDGQYPLDPRRIAESFMAIERMLSD